MVAICITANAAQTESVKDALHGKTLGKVGILNVYSGAYPDISLSVFINNSCASSGGLQRDDFTITEEGSKVAINNFSFTGQANGQSVDFVIVFDDTGSMSDKIEAMKFKVQDLIDQIARRSLDTRYALISFKDSESLKSSWTKDAASFKSAVNSLQAYAGDDTPEDALDAIDASLSLGFRPNAHKVVLVITDAAAHQIGDGEAFTEHTRSEIRANLLQSGAIFIVVSPAQSPYVAPYLDLKDLANDVGGTWIDMESADFSNILDQITTMITGMYVLEYTSPDLSQKTTRNIEVSVSNSSCASGQATSSYPLPGTLGTEEPASGPASIQIPNFNYAGDGNGGQVTDPFATDGTNIYKVTLEKKLEKPINGGCQDIVINLTPDQIPTRAYVVFAIDHSGSTFQGLYSQDIVDGISDALVSVSGVRYQRVDWNDQIVYSSKKFNDSGNWGNEDQPPSRPDPRPEEEQPTVYSVGLKEAVDKIITQKNSPTTTPLARKTTSWKVIFITGKSEFSRGVPPNGLADYNNAITKARNDGVDIYTMGIKLSDTDPTTLDERKALQNEMPVNDGFAQLQDVAPSVRNFVGKGVSRILSGSGAYYSGSVAKNVTITESMYEYLRPIGSNIQPSSQKVNPDQSTTMTFDLKNLKGGETKTVRIYTELDLSKLPVDINESKSQVDFSPDAKTQASKVTYTSLLDEQREIDMPEGRLSIFCGMPCSSTVPSTIVLANETKPSGPKESTSRPAEKTPGFEVAFVAVGIVAATYLRRRW